MSQAVFVSPDDIRAAFARSMSDMYRAEVPLYGDLVAIVDSINDAILRGDPAREADLLGEGGRARLAGERHGAIRVGTAAELSLLRRAFAVMGMHPVGYYDLTPAGVPVHSTAFRPVDPAALARNPFRIFTSLLRPELLEDPTLRSAVAEILARRSIVSQETRALIRQAEAAGGLTPEQAGHFVSGLIETFRWHADAMVTAQTYEELSEAHRLVADVVAFRGPHINHLTPRTLDIDAAHAELLRRGIDAKADIEGPPRRAMPILLRQTSFKALSEPIRFVGSDGSGTHAARFGEIEQRGLALTPKGRALYDDLLARARDAEAGPGPGGYVARLREAFAAFPDDAEALRAGRLAYFRYRIVDDGRMPDGPATLDALIAAGAVVADPIIYEDFLPVSAAGIFQSNLGGQEQRGYAAPEAQGEFEDALGEKVLDPFALYAAIETASRQAVLAAFEVQASA